MAGNVTGFDEANNPLTKTGKRLKPIFLFHLKI
jgi:hypothetical protein